MNMLDLGDERLKAIKEAAMGDLFKIPGVDRVGIGLKMVGGSPSGGIAIRVTLIRKKPEAEVPPDQRVPDEIQGIPTDVIERESASEDPSNVCPQEVNDDQKLRPIRGGILLRLHPNQAVPIESQGTLGCMAYTLDTERKVVLLSAHHVLLNLGHKVGDRVGQTETCPMYSECCSDHIATVLLGEFNNKVDAAFALLDPKIDWCSEIIDIGAVRGTHTIRLSDLLPTGYPVKKRGYRTGLTKGVVTELYLSRRGGRRDFDNGISVDPVPPFPQFSCSGDSGSVLLNDNNEVVGLLTLRDGISSIATPIADVEAELNIQIANDKPCTHQDRLAVGSGGRGDSTLTTKTAPDIDSPNPAAFGQPGFLSQAQEEILQTAKGKAYTEIIRLHQYEVRRLINTNKRVAVVWHRNGGTTILQKVAQTIRDRNTALPNVIEDQPLSVCVNRILDSVAKYASPRLRSDIADWRSALVELGSYSFNEFLAMLNDSSRQGR
jgi:hypothetical protein